MKHIFSRYILLVFAICISALAAKSQWPRVEIHHIGTGDGDATLIIGIDQTQTGYIDTVTMLIDGQRYAKSGTAIWNYVRDTLTALSPTRTKLDFLVLSHTHIDHYGGLIQFMTNLGAAGWTIDKVIDRGGTGPKVNLTWTLDSSYKYACIDNDVVDLDEFTSTALKYAALANKYSRITILPGKDIFDEKNFNNLSMICVAAVGAALNWDPGRDPKAGLTYFLRYNTTTGHYTPYNENDLSYAFNLGLRTFNFFTGGDIGGGAPYADGETPIAQFFNSFFGPGNFHFCGIKVSHHGSAHSTNANFLAGLKPSMAVISASLRSYSGTALPTQTTINALTSSTVGQNIKFCFVPYNPNTPSSYWTYGNRQYYQDVVLKVIGLPVPNRSVSIQIATRTRDNNLAFTGLPTVTTFTCNQTHTCTFK